MEQIPDKTHDSAAAVESLFRAQRTRLWGLAYRLTGSAADADDIVQESFARLVQRPPVEAGGGLGAWLVRVVTNLGLDHLRRRKRRGYQGPWLPQPVADAGHGRRQGAASPEPGPVGLEAPEGDEPERRYGMAESTTYAFLIALEALGPRQRAVLLLRDVVGYSAEETARVLDVTDSNVRVLHLRARRALASYDQQRCPPTAEAYRRHHETLERFVRCLWTQDAHGLETLLTESVRTSTDANGEYTALPAPLIGRSRVARLYLTAARHRQAAEPRFEIISVNGMPALLIALGRPVRRQAPYTLLRFDLDGDGLIRELHTILAAPKLAEIRFPPPL